MIRELCKIKKFLHRNRRERESVSSCLSKKIMEKIWDTVQQSHDGGVVYFDEDVGNIHNQTIVDCKDINKSLKPIFEDDTITTVGILKTPLWYHPITQLVAFHTFIVFYTEKGWWWTMEKTIDGVSVCRSKDLRRLLGNYRGEDRKKPIEQILLESTVTNLRDVLDFLEKSDHVKDVYNAVTSNSHTFTLAAFNTIVADEQRINFLQLHVASTPHAEEDDDE